MIHLIPGVKILQEKDGFLREKAVFCKACPEDARLMAALNRLPVREGGVPLEISLSGAAGESYELWIQEAAIRIQAEGPAGAFYAIQTLRQLFAQQTVPCLYIRDTPDFAYRGFYHDVTRGKVPTVETVKQLIDQMAYCKLNSLQLYVEHTYEFEECKALNEACGCLTKEELQELDRYCRENFIEFVPSLSTFGHMYEILQQKQYQHLRVRKDYEEEPNFWHARMGHHTIDPLLPESIALVKSLIDQYEPAFTSDMFNICCDETFDLKVFEGTEYDEGRLYVDFVKKIIAHVQSKGKQVQMWADILLQHPETIHELPEDTVFLNWFYSADPPEDKVAALAGTGRKQIVCPGTTTWNRLCENVDVEEKNISRLVEYGYRHGAIGVLNTNWGDWGNPCSLELAMYGLALGAEKSWNALAPVDDAFRASVDHLVYGREAAWGLLARLSRVHDDVKWTHFCRCYFARRYEGAADVAPFGPEHVEQVQAFWKEFRDALAEQTWEKDEYRQELLISAEGLCVIAELLAKLGGFGGARLTDTEAWLQKYREKWIRKNKESELRKIEEMMRWCDAV